MLEYRLTNSLRQLIHCVIRPDDRGHDQRLYSTSGLALFFFSRRTKRDFMM